MKIMPFMDEYTSGPRVEGRGTLIVTLDGLTQEDVHLRDDIQADIKYFKKKLEQSYHVETRNKAKEQLAILEDAEATRLSNIESKWQPILDQLDLLPLQTNKKVIPVLL